MGGRRSSRHSRTRTAVGAAALMAVLVSGLVTARPAGAAPIAPASPAVPAAPSAPAAAPPVIPPLAPVDPGPDGSVPITRVESPATATIPPLGPVDPGPDGSVSIERAPVVLDPPVEPGPLTLPLTPAQVLIDAAAANALATLGAAVPSFLGPGGTPDLDPSKLQPQVGSAQPLSTQPATLAQVVEAILNLQLPPPLPIDPLALLQALPDGIPRLTYRLCSESTTKAVSCSISVPLAVPVLADVTGDGTVDVLADLLPAVSPNAVLAAVRELLDLQTLLAATESRLASVLALLANPLALLRNPGLLFEALRLQQLVVVLLDELTDKVEALVSLVNLGLGLLVLRLPSSETAGSDLPAHVWAVYDLPGHRRLSVGFDGFRRGTTLPDATVGIFTFDALAAAGGVFDVRGALRQSGAGTSLAVTLGLAGVAPDQQGTPVDPTVASAQFSPVPSVFDAHAVVDLAEEEGSIDTTSDRPSRLDAIVVTRRGGPVAPFGRFTQLVVDQLPTSLRAELTRPPTGGAVSLEYRASAPIATVRLSDFEYSGITLQRALAAQATGIPTAIDATLRSSSAAQDIDIALDYTASGRMGGLGVGIFDRPAANLVATASLVDIPSGLDLTVDLPDDHVAFIGNGRLGLAEAVVSRGLGSFSQLGGDHTTLVVAGAGLGVSARVTGMRSVDAFFGSHPRATARFEPGGQPFVAAGDIDGIFKARLDVSNLPAFISADLDPAAGTLSYDASSVIAQVKAAFIKTDTGPTVFATVFDVPASIDATWVLGERNVLTYDASSAIPRIDFFASPQPIEALQPLVHHYLSVAVIDIPTEVALTVDFAARHIEGVMSAPLGQVLGVARFPFAGDVFAAALDLQGVPAHFDADFHDGFYRFRGLTGPVASAALSISNHAGTDAPVGQHLAVRFREVTGAFDASVFVRNLSHVEFSRGTGAQTFRLDVDTVGEPLFVDADVVLAAGGVDDTRLAAFARVDGLPSTLMVRLAAGELVYTATSPVSILAEFRVGKVAALSGLGAPIFDHGLALAARGCAPGPGCATDATPLCTSFSSCMGVVATAHMPGLPSSIAVDMDARQVEILGWQPPPGVPFQAYIRLLGLVPAVPEVEALAAITGLPSPLDITVGPISLGGAGDLDVAYTASAPIGTLDVALEAHDTPTLGTLRGTATALVLPASLHIAGEFGELTRVSVDNSAPTDLITATVTGTSTGYLSATLTSVPAQVDFELDLDARHAEYTASSTLGAVTVLARAPFGGRTWGAFLGLIGVPTEWTADFGDGTIVFDVPSGAISSAELAITNHGGAEVPDSSSYLRGFYRELTGDLDAGVRVTGLSHIEITRTSVTTRFQLDSGIGTVVLDANALLTDDVFGTDDDTQFKVVAHLDTPNTFRVTIGSGTVTYRADQPVDLLAEVHVGKVAALNLIGAPLFDNGIGARARGCNPGPQCAPDPGSPICDTFGKCAGVVAIANLPGLPTEVVVNLDEKQVRIDGYDPPAAPLQLFLQVDDLIATVPHAAALATLTGLPPSLDLTLGPFQFEDGDITEFHVGYEGSASIGELEVHAEADTTTIFGDLRGHALLSPVPASAQVSGEFGSASNVQVVMSEPINVLTLQVTGLLQGNPASGLVAFTNVPASIDLDITGFAEEALGVPTITYTSDNPSGLDPNTLDGLVQVEADLIEAFSTGGVAIPIAGEVWARITNLGSFTTVEVNPDKSVNLSSDPDTDEIALGATIDSSVANIPLNLQVFDTAGFTGTLVGHVGAPTIHIGDIELSIRGLRSMRLSPSQVTYLTTGIEGDYDELSIFVDDVFVDPDVVLTLEVDGPLFLDFDIGPIVIDDPFTGVRFHVSDQVLRESGCVAVEVLGVGVGHVRIFTKPGKLDTEVNQITMFGADGPQALNYIDPVPTPLGLVPALVSIGIDLLTVYVTDPFTDAEASYEPGTGGC